MVRSVAYYRDVKMYQLLTKLILAGAGAALCAVIGTPAAFAQNYAR